MNEMSSTVPRISEDDRSVIRQLAAHVRDKSTDLGAESTLIPAEIYTDPIRFEAEKRGIFQSLPMLACLSVDIPNPGDTHLFEDAGPPILLVRNRDGKVNAFLNMCAHRGARLVSECGSAKRFACPFHAWTYDLEGRLVGVPRREAFDPKMLEGRALVRVPVGEWGGLVFVKAKPGDEAIDVQEWLGGFAPIVAAMQAEAFKPVATGRFDFTGNWKYALDTYGEGYHVAHLHKETLNKNYFGDIIDITRHGLHYRMAFATRQFQETVGKDEQDWPELSYSPVFFLFPNIAFNIQPMPDGRAWFNVHKVFPGRQVGEGYTRFATYKADMLPLGEDGLAPYVAGHEMIMQVVGTEDYGVVAGAQLALAYAPAGFCSVFGRHEHPAAETQLEIARLAGMPL